MSFSLTKYVLETCFHLATTIPHHNLYSLEQKIQKNSKKSPKNAYQNVPFSHLQANSSQIAQEMGFKLAIYLP